MTVIKYVDADNNVTEVEAESGESIMSLAVNNMVDGIVGECGGAQACATCHCYLDKKYASHFSEISEMEEAMLESAPQQNARSRLSCQLMLNDDTPDIEVSLPSSQY
jgi:2Fe-2S ferredoxin